MAKGLDDINFDAYKEDCREALVTELRKILTTMRVDHSGLSDLECRDLYRQLVQMGRKIAGRAGYFEGEL